MVHIVGHTIYEGPNTKNVGIDIVGAHYISTHNI